jgi:hypothetical protein
VDLLQVRVMLNIMRMLRLVSSLLHMVEDTTSLLPPDILRDSLHPEILRFKGTASRDILLKLL